MNNTQQAKINWITSVVVILALFILPFILAQFGKTGEFWIWVSTEISPLNLETAVDRFVEDLSH